MKQTISFSGGKVALDHNRRSFKNSKVPSNIDQSRSHLNEYYVTCPAENLEKRFNEIFADDVAEYNARQKRKDRRIDNYYRHCLNNKKINSNNLVMEYVVQIGNADTFQANEEDIVKTLHGYAESFEWLNPELKLISATLHRDEETPHLHVTFVPYATNKGKNGLAHQPLIYKALENQGIKMNPETFEKSLPLWKKVQEKEIEKVVLRHFDIERAYGDGRKKHMPVDEFKVFTAKQKEREEVISKLDEHIDYLQDQKTTLQKDVDILNYQSSELRPEVTKLRTDKEELTDDKRKLAAEVSELANEVTKLRTDKEELADDKRKLAADVSDLTDKVTKLQSDKEELTDDKRKLAADVSDLTDKVTKLQSDKEELADDKRKLAAEVSKLSDQKSDLSSEVKKLGSTKDELKTECSSWQNALNGLKNEFSTWNKALDRFKRKVVELWSWLSPIEREMAHLKEQEIDALREDFKPKKRSGR